MNAFCVYATIFSLFEHIIQWRYYRNYIPHTLKTTLERRRNKDEMEGPKNNNNNKSNETNQKTNEEPKIHYLNVRSCAVILM